MTDDEIYQQPNRLPGNIGDSRGPAIESAARRVWEFITFSKYIGELPEYDESQGTKAAMLIKFFKNHSLRSIISSTLCSEDFMGDFAQWLCRTARTISNKMLASGTVQDTLSGAKAIMFESFPEAARILYDTPNATCLNGIATWYTQLRRKVVTMCGSRDLQQFGSLQEGIKKHVIGR